MLSFEPIRLVIRDLRVLTTVGVYAHERTQSQELILKIEIVLANKSLPKSDELCDTVDYAVVAQIISDWMKLQNSHLLEHLAHQTILRVFEIDSRVDEVHLEIFKPGCIPLAEGAAVKSTCRRK